MPNPTLRLIHNLARSGGTLIGKCVGCMSDVILLSEINPRGLSRFNPIDQASRWFELLTDDDLASIEDPKTAPLPELIDLVYRRAEERGASLVIRDWAHLDYVAVPFETEPVNRLSLADALADTYDLRQIAITRHPMEQTESTFRILPPDNLPTLEHVLTAQRRYAEAAVDIGFVRYEDFVAETDGELRKICDKLELEYDPGYADRWAAYSTITGDTGAADGTETTISLPPRKPPPPEILERLLANSDYQKTCELLGYPPE